MKVLVADDHALMREGIKLALNRLSDDVSIYEASSGASVLQALGQQPDMNLVLLDLFMPDTDGFALLSQLCRSYPDLSVAILSASEDIHDIRRAIEQGALGYIPKSMPEGEMLDAFRIVSQGEVYLPKHISLEEGLVEDGALGDPPRLTNRQTEVLHLLAEGHTNKVIARNLGLSEYTIKIHVTAILKLLNATNRTQAVVEARRKGLLSSSPKY